MTLKLFLTAATILASQFVSASMMNGKIHVMQPGSGTLPFFIYMYGPAPTGIPACGTQTNAGQDYIRYVVDPSTSAGKATIATIMLAQAQNKSFSVYGTGDCKIWGDTETIQWVQIWN